MEETVSIVDSVSLCTADKSNSTKVYSVPVQLYLLYKGLYKTNDSKQLHSLKYT